MSAPSDPSTLAGAVAVLLAAREHGPEALLEAAEDLSGYYPSGHPVRSIIRRIRALIEDGAEIPLIDEALGRLHGLLVDRIGDDPRVAELAEQIRRDHGVALRNAARVHRGHQAKAEDSVQNHIETLVVGIALELPLVIKPYTVRSTYRRAGDLRRAESARRRSTESYLREVDVHEAETDQAAEAEDAAWRRRAARSALRDRLRGELTPLERRVLRATWRAAREGRWLTRDELAREVGSKCLTHVSRLRTRMIEELTEFYRRALDRIDGL